MPTLANGTQFEFEHVTAVRPRDKRVAAAREKMLAGERLSQEDGIHLFDAPVLDLGRLADAYKRDLHGDRVYFTVNRQLNPTNVCVYRCSFCAFRADLRDERGYLMSDEQI